MSERRDQRFELDGGSIPALSGDRLFADPPRPDTTLDAADRTPDTREVTSSNRTRTAFDVPESSRYVRAHVLGLGGMGRVIQAFDQRLSREVAIKEVARSSVDAEERERRLMREASITARLDHPGIVPVHDAGRLPDGNLFYAMRVVRGRSLATAIAEAADAEARRHLLRHVLDACHAIAWAHRHGVVHRDIKPANIMVGEFGETQVVDWGLAAELDSARAAGRFAHASDAEVTGTAPLSEHLDDAELTRAGAIIGTPRYMSPEQAMGLGATRRSDVWSLGCVLYETAAGFAAVSEGSSEEVIDRVRRGETRDLEPLAPQVPAELRAIIRRALRPDPERRYPDAKALADDLASHLDGRRVSAHDYSAWELLVRLVRAWRRQLMVAGVALVALVIFILVAFSRIADERTRALEAETAALASAESSRIAERRAVEALAESDRSLSRALTDEAIGRAATDARPEAEILAAHAVALGESPLALGVLSTWDALEAPSLLARLPVPEGCVDLDISPSGELLACREREALSLHRLSPALGQAPTSAVHPIWRAPVQGRGVALAAEAGFVVTGDPYVHMALFALADGRRMPSPTLSCCGLPPRASSNGRSAWVAGAGRLAVIHGGLSHELALCSSQEEVAGTVDDEGERWAQTCRDGTLFLGGITAGSVRSFSTGFGVPEVKGAEPRAPSPIRGRAPASVLAFSRDGRGVILANTIGAVALFDLESESIVRVADSGVAMTRQIVASPDGGIAAILGDRSGVRIWDLDNGEWHGSLPDRPIRSIRFLEHEARDLVTFGDEIRVWRLASGRPTRLFAGDGVTSIAASRNNGTVAVTRGKGLTVFEPDGRRIFDGSWHDSIVKGGSFSPDGRAYVATANTSRRITTFNTETWHRYGPVQAIDFNVREVQALAAPDDGVPIWVAASHKTSAFAFVDMDTVPLDLLADHGRPVIHDLARTADGRFLVALAPAEGDLLRIDTYLGLAASRWHIGRDATSLALAEDGETVLATEGELIAEYLLVDEAELQRVYLAPRTVLIAAAISPDGRFVAAGGRDGSTWLWERAGSRLRAVFRDHEQRTSAVAFLPSGLLASGSWDWTVRLRSLAAIDRSPSEWVELVERRWGLALDDVLHAGF